jgi:biopolymer transport protein ExbD/biopolymer transport protein TolR
MAFSVNNGGGSRSRFRGTSTMAEMNIVPLVDVVLVLLIIFMITAQAMNFGLEIEVPKVKQVRTTIDDLPVVSITRSGELYIQENPVNINELGDHIKAKFPESPAVYVMSDRLATFETFAHVADALRRSELEVRVVTQPEEDTREAR